MKIDISESTLKITICSLKTYLNKCLDIDEDTPEMIIVAKALGELQGAFNALKDSEHRNKMTISEYIKYRQDLQNKQRI